MVKWLCYTSSIQVGKRVTKIINKESKPPKDIKFHLNIADHDKQTKLNHVKKFLDQHYKVRLSVQLIGRQQAHPERAVEFLNDTIQYLADFGIANSNPVVKGRDANVLISPKAHH